MNAITTDPAAVFSTTPQVGCDTCSTCMLIYLTRINDEITVHTTRTPDHQFPYEMHVYNREGKSLAHRFDARISNDEEAHRAHIKYVKKYQKFYA